MTSAWSSMPARNVPLKRDVPLSPGEARLERRVPLKRVSARRAAENRQRRKVVTALWPERPPCARCGRGADDVHEPRFRSRGGSITDQGNMTPLCRTCHGWAHAHPDAAAAAGLAVHTWDEHGGAA